MAASAPFASSVLSARRIRANRRNAKKSTGPKTAAGKARSCRNATGYGIFCQRPTAQEDSPRSGEDTKTFFPATSDPFEPGFIETSLLRRRADEQRSGGCPGDSVVKYPPESPLLLKAPGVCDSLRGKNKENS